MFCDKILQMNWKLLLKFVLKIFPILFITFVLFNKAIFFHEVLYYGDNFHLNAPLKTVFIDAFLEKVFPTWNPYIFLGMPYFSDLNLGTLYPLNFLYLMFENPLRSLTIQVVIDIFLLCCFMYLFLRNKKITYVGSLFGAIVFAFSGEIFQYINNVTILNVIIFIPLIFFILDKFKYTKNFFYLNLLIVTQAIQLVSGHPQISYYTILLCLFSMLQISVSIKKRFFFCIYYFLFSISLSAIQLFPFLELSFNSNRITNIIQNFTTGNLTIFKLVTFIFPTIFGTIKDGTWWGKQLNLVGYLGIPTLIILVVGIFQIKSKKAKPYLFLAFACLVLSFGIPYINFFIPGFVFFRNPEQILIFFAFFLTISASLFLDELKKKKIIINKTIIFINLYMFIYFIIIYFLWILQSKYIYFLVKNAHLKILYKISNFNSDKFNFIIGNTILEFAFFSFFSFSVLIILFLKRKIPEKLFYFLIIFLISCNLMYFDSKVILTTSIKNIQKINKNVIQIDPLYRIITLPINLSIRNGALPGNDFFLREANINSLLLQGNNNLYMHVQQVNGYSALVPSNVSIYFNSNNVTGINFGSEYSKKLEEASVKYIFSKNQINFHNESIHLIYSNDNEFVYENNLALPRLSFDKCDNCYLDNIVFSLNKITFTVIAPKETSLIIRDMYYPGWIFRANSLIVPRYAYNNIFSEFKLKKGIYKVVYEYKQQYLELGMLVTIISIIIMLFGYVFEKRIYKFLFFESRNKKK